MNEIETEIERQVSKYVFHGDVIVRTEVIPIKLPISNTNSIRINIDISTTQIDPSANYFQAGKSERGEKGLSLDFALLGNTENNKIISKLIN